MFTLEDFIHQAAALVPMADVNTPGIKSWLLTNIVPLIMAVIGLGILASARKGRLSEVLSTATIVLVGLFFIVGAGAMVAFGQTLSELFIR